MKNTLDHRQKLWALAALIPFLLSILLLGYALRNQVLLAFAVGWPALQIFGYVGSLKLANGDLTHYLFKAQVFLNYMVLALLVAVIVRAL
ncbi:pyridoxal phosphate biosynthetic protein [Erythrobacter sp. W53]|uniref:pyridoxal phosphate biosynthetic protein n=1 Tax=Erythrobacter sp. W53 TaxID=3425947 RepID=UPI003D768924